MRASTIDDAVDYLQQVVVVAEGDVGFLHLAATLNVDALGAVDEDVADGEVLQEDFQRAQAEGLIEHLVDEPFPLVAVQERVFGVAEVLHDQADLATQYVAFQLAHPRQVQLVDKLAVDPLLQLLEAALLRFCGTQTDSGWFHGRSISGGHGVMFTAGSKR